MLRTVLVFLCSIQSLVEPTGLRSLFSSPTDGPTHRNRLCGMRGRMGCAWRRGRGEVRSPIHGALGRPVTIPPIRRVFPAPESPAAARGRGWGVVTGTGWPGPQPAVIAGIAVHEPAGVAPG